MNRYELHGVVFALVLGACGGGAPATKAPAPVRETEHQHPALPPGPEAFHNVLSPIWHAEPGPTRIAIACEKTQELGQRATALVIEPTPAEARAKEEPWRVATAALVGQVDALATACGVEGRLDVETKLAAVHDAFHQVGAVVSEMGDHGDHGPRGGTGQHGGPGER
jgi:hypothetical protein